MADGIAKTSLNAEVPTQPAGWTEAAGGQRIERTWWVVLGVTMLVFSAFPIANLVLGFPDQGLRPLVPGGHWQSAKDLMSTPGPRPGGFFPSCIPPPPRPCSPGSACLGRTGSLLALVLVNSAAWLASILLSVYLSEGRGTASSAGPDPSLALHHRPGAQHLSAGSAQSFAAGSAAGGLCLPGARAPARSRFLVPRQRPSRRFRSWPWDT